MSRWKENLDTKKSTGDGVFTLARRFFCAFLIISGFIFLADGLTDYGFEKKNDEKVITVNPKSDDVGTGHNVDTEYSNVNNSDIESYYKPDFETLKLINPDIIAWIRIPGMSIDEPIVQTTDNEYYLNIGFDGKKNSAGTVFLDFESKPDASDYHSIFYGHHMKNGSRFAELVRLKDKDFFSEHRMAYLYFSDGSSRRLRFIAALSADSSAERRKTEFANPEELYFYMEKMTDGCKFREIPENTVSHLYSFVTCSYEFKDARTIVYAVESTT